MIAARQMATSLRSRALLPGLHGLRALAAITSILAHLAPLTTLRVPPWLGGMPNFFGLGVSLFFVISGFSLSYSNYDRVSQAAWVRGYLIKRLLRIAPLFYAVMAFTAGFFYLRHSYFSWPIYAINLTFTFNLVPGQQQGIVFAGWTIGVEMIFYAMLPTVLMTIRSVVGAAMLYTLSIAVYLGANSLLTAAGMNPALTFIANAHLFCGGILGYFILRRVDQAGISRALVGYVAAPLTVAFLAASLTVSWVFWGMFFATLCVWQSHAPGIVCGSRPFVFIGERSYSVYLLQPLVLMFMTPALLAVERASAALIGSFTYVLCGAIILAIVVALSQVTYFAIERPFMQLAARLARREA